MRSHREREGGHLLFVFSPPRKGSGDYSSLWKSTKWGVFPSPLIQCFLGISCSVKQYNLAQLSRLGKMSVILSENYAIGDFYTMIILKEETMNMGIFL